jgi:hypothetical protein
VGEPAAVVSRFGPAALIQANHHLVKLEVRVLQLISDDCQSACAGFDILSDGCGPLDEVSGQPEKS